MPDCRVCSLSGCLVCAPGFLLAHGTCVSQCPPPSTRAGDRCLGPGPEQPLALAATRSPVTVDGMPLQQAIGPIARTHMRPGPDGQVVITAGSLALRQWLLLVPSAGATPARLATLQPTGELLVDQSPGLALPVAQLHSYLELGPMVADGVTWLFGVGCSQAGVLTITRFECRLPSSSDSQAASQSTSHEGEPHCVVSIGPPEPLLSGGSSVCRVLAPLGDRGQMASIQMHDSQDRISIYTITLNPLVPAGYRVSMLLHGTSPPAIFPLPASWSSPGDPWLLEAGGTGTALNPLRLRHSVDPRAMLPWEHSAPGPGLDPAQFATHRRPVVLPTPGRGPDHPNEVLLSGVYPGPGHLVWDAQHIPLGSHAHARTRDLPTYVTLLGAIPGAGVPGPGPEYALLGVELPEQADHPAALVLVTSSHLAIARLHCPADLAPECFLLRATVQALGPGVGPLAGPQHAVAVALPAPGPGAGALSPGARAGDGPADPPAVGFLLAGVGLDGPLLVTLGAVECSPGEYGPACEPCDAACAECTGPGPDACVACFLSLPDDPGACVAECPTGTVPGPGGGVCVCAAAGCSGCQGTGPAGAYECSACAVGFAPDPLPGVACSPCHHACDGCSKPDSPFFCHACAGAFFLVPDGGGCQADCPDGTWKNPANHRCSRCIDNCQRCTSADVCEACYPRAILAPDQRACRACHPSCLTCTPDGSCDTCQPGLVFLEPDGPGGSLCGNVCPPGEHVGTDRCMACHGACALCSGPGSTQCQVCAAGYRWAGLAPRPGAAGECVACPPGCASCDMSDRCLSCLAGYFLAPGATCGQACPAGHFADLADGSCQACDISCATCTGPDADQCDSCPPGLGLAPVVAGLAGACVSGCPAGHYRDPVSGGCAPCDAACAACNGPSDQDCWSCPPGLADVLQDGACVLACAGGHVAVARRCLPCHGTCRECTGTRSTDCTDCPSHLLALPMGAPSAGRCVAGCPVGYHWQPGGCARCADQCSSCPASPTACTLCDRGWLLQGPGCVSQCSRGLLPLNGQCTVCHGTCGTCFGPAADQCASCPEGSGLRLHGGACVAACPAGTFTEAATCLPCDGTCAECAGPGAQGCTACPPGRVLATWGACLEACPAGEYATGGGLPGPGAGTCRACDGSCARCTGPGWQECTACRGGDFLHAGACLAACPGGLFGCPGTGGCSACPEHCAACRPASGPPGGPPCQAECTACAPGFHLSPGASSCVEACPPGEFLPAGGQACQTCDPACASCVERADNCTACARPGAWLDLGSGMCSGACAGGGVAPVDFGPAALPQRVCLPCPLNCEACPVGGPAGGGGGGGGLPPCELAASGRLVCPPITGCARCQAGMRLMPEGPASPAQCLSVCPARYFPAAAASGEVCTPCHASCERCAGPTADDCIGSPGRSPRRDLALGLGLGLGLGLLLLGLLILWALLLVHRRRRKCRCFITRSSTCAAHGSSAGMEDALSTMLNTLVELSLPGSILVDIGAEFTPLPEEDLGAGTQATVFAARATGPNTSARLGCPEVVAIKRLKAEQLRPSQATLFQNEVALMWLLRDCPQVVRLYGYSQAPPAIVMERYQAGLDTLLHSQVEIPPAILLDIVQQWACGLAAMHAAGIAHCDLKPGNVFVQQLPGGAWHAALGDLGTSRSVSAERFSALVSEAPELNAMTARYAAPEVLEAFQQRRPLDRDLFLPADIYSAAIMLWECLERTVPWRGCDFSGISALVLSGVRPEAATPAGMDPLVADLLGAAWDAAPLSRLTAAVFHQRCVDLPLPGGV